MDAKHLRDLALLLVMVPAAVACGIMAGHCLDAHQPVFGLGWYLSALLLAYHAGRRYVDVTE